MIYLSEKDILASVEIKEVLDCVESAMLLYETKDFLMPPRMHVEKNGDVLLVMPCFTRDSFGTKLVTLFGGNAKRNIPVLNGIVVLNDVKTGVPVAMLNGRVLTALRTGAVGGVSIRHLAAEDAHTFGIIGAGVQGYFQALLASAARGLTDIYVYDINEGNSHSLVDKLTVALGHVNIHGATSVEELVANCECVTAATTSTRPVLPEKAELLQGKHFVGIGSYQPHVREFPSTLYTLIETVYVDTEHAVDESGDLIVPLKNGWIAKEQVKTLGGYIAAGVKKPRTAEETTFFKSVGMALFDVCVSKLVYDKAVKKGLGQQIEL